MTQAISRRNQFTTELCEALVKDDVPIYQLGNVDFENILRLGRLSASRVRLLCATPTCQLCTNKNWNHQECHRTRQDMDFDR